MTLVDAVLKAAILFRFVREEPKGSNAGQAVEFFQRTANSKKGEPWCCSFVCTILDGMIEKMNPLPMTDSCAALGNAAKARGLLSKTPIEGAVFLLWFPSKGRFAHTGFLVSKNPDGSWNTIEGNTGDEGEREGYGVLPRKRTFGIADKFIHWQKGLE